VINYLFVCRLSVVLCAAYEQDLLCNTLFRNLAWITWLSVRWLLTALFTFYIWHSFAVR